MSVPPLIIDAHVYSKGVLEDGVSPDNHNTLRVTHVKPDCWLTESECKDISSSLAEIENEIVSEDGNRVVYINFQFMYESIQRLQSCGYSVANALGFAVYSIICNLMSRPKLSFTDEQIISGVGTNLWNTLMVFQRVAVKRGILERRLYLAEDMGLGKTISSIAISFFYRSLGVRLIICLASLTYNWREEIRMWGEKDGYQPNVYIVKSSKHLDKIPEDVDYIIMSFGMLAYEPKDKSKLTNYERLTQNFRPQVVIIDESHKMNNVKSKTGKVCRQICQQATCCYLLSGTPCQFSKDLYNPLMALEPKHFRYENYFHWGRRQSGTFYFCDTFCEPKQVQFGKHGPKRWELKGYRNQTQLCAIMNTVMIRRRKWQVMTQLPRKNRILCKLPPVALKIEKEIQEILKSEDGEIARAYEITAIAKLPNTLKILQERWLQKIEKEPILFFFHHKETRRGVQKLFKENGIDFFVIDGSTPKKRRFEYVQEFQGGKYQCALLSIKAAGTGLTLTRSSTVVFLELLWNPAWVFQAEDRVHRKGQTSNTCDIVYFVAPKSTDDVQIGVIKKKTRESTKILENRNIKVAMRRVNASEAMQMISLSKNKKKCTRKKRKNAPNLNMVVEEPKKKYVRKERKRKSDILL